jgi:hypothetical protein
MKETFIPILVLLILYLVLSLEYKKENFESLKQHQKQHQKHHQKHHQKIYTPEILNPEVQPRIYAIANSIIKKINDDLKQNYQLGQFENVIEDKDTEGNPRYVLDFFVYLMNSEYVNDITRRVIADVSIYLKSGELQINTLNFSNSIKDQGPQYLPIKDDNVDQLIIKPELTGKDYNPSGGAHLKQFRGSLEYGKFDPLVGSEENTKYKCRDEHQDWILPTKIQEKKYNRVFPCVDYGDWWDTNGIQLTKTEEDGLKKLDTKCARNFSSELKSNVDTSSLKEKELDKCYNSYNTATTPRTIIGNFYPNHASYRPDHHTLDNHWLFKTDTDIIGFPHAGSSNTGY